MTWSENQFGKLSKLQLTSAQKNGKSYLENVYHTAPFKIMKPFIDEKGHMQVMILSASAGMMAGDTQEIQILVKEGSHLEITSQAYEKIHKMDEGYASRKTNIQVRSNASLFYHPQTVIPFAGSSFENHTEIRLESEKSKCILCEILSSGRTARGERFAYRRYKSITDVYVGEELIYRENILYEPDKTDVEGIGMLEGYSHQGSLVFFHYQFSEDVLKEFWKTAENQERINLEIGMTKDFNGNLVFRMLGNSAQELEKAMQSLLNQVLNL